MGKSTKKIRIKVTKDEGSKVAVKSKGKKSKEKKERSASIVGKTSGLGVAKTWAKVFGDNETASKNNKLTDEGIAKAMKKEFTSRDSDIFNHVQLVRNRYNKGVLTGGKVPTKESKRYDNKGNPVTARGKAID